MDQYSHMCDHEETLKTELKQLIVLARENAAKLDARHLQKELTICSTSLATECTCLGS